MEKTADQNVSCLKKELQLGNGEKTIDLTEIKNVLLQDEKLNTENTFDLDFLSLQDEDLVNILEELQNRTEVSGNNITENTNSNRFIVLYCNIYL